MIKYQTKRFVEVNDWDNLVKSIYGKPYAFQQQEGCKDRSIFNLQIPVKRLKTLLSARI